MRSIVSPKLLARLVCVIFYHLRRSSAAHRDFCGPKAIGQMLQYFQFFGVQWFAQEKLGSFVTLTSSPTRLHCEADVRELTTGAVCAGFLAPFLSRKINLASNPVFQK